MTRRVSIRVSINVSSRVSVRGVGSSLTQGPLLGTQNEAAPM